MLKLVILFEICVGSLAWQSAIHEARFTAITRRSSSSDEVDIQARISRALSVVDKIKGTSYQQSYDSHLSRPSTLKHGGKVLPK